MLDRDFLLFMNMRRQELEQEVEHNELVRKAKAAQMSSVRQFSVKDRLWRLVQGRRTGDYACRDADCCPTTSQAEPVA